MSQKMVSIFIIVCIIFFFTLIIGKFLENIKVPWLFGALIFGALMSGLNIFSNIIKSDIFNFLAQLGMYFLLFIIGFDINVKEMKKIGTYIITSTFFIIILEALFGSLIIHYFFGYNWVVSSIIALSFATVGEAILIPILDEFHIVNTKLGQLIIGIGVFDDIIELATLILAIALIGSKAGTQIHPTIIILALAILFAITFIFSRLKKEGIRFQISNLEKLFAISIIILFLFIGVGAYASAAPLAAFLAGISLRALIPKKEVDALESDIRVISYGFFAPFFFFSIGTSVNLSYLLSSPLMLLIITAIIALAKITGSWIMFHNQLSLKEVVLLGVGLSVRFSTSIVITKILLDAQLIDKNLYSILIASSVVLTFLVPLLFSYLTIKWKITSKYGKKSSIIKYSH